MTGVDELVAWLRTIWDARERELDEDEQWARAASQAYPYSPGATVSATGVHWRWVAGEDWDTVTVDPVIDEFVAEPGYPCNLATVEEWPTGNRVMPRTYAHSIVEMDASAAGHIARWDPARVLHEVATERAEIDAKRRMLDAIMELRRPSHSTQNVRGGKPGTYRAYPVGPDPREHLVRLLALPYAGRDGWREEWRA